MFRIAHMFDFSGSLKNCSADIKNSKSATEIDQLFRRAIHKTVHGSIIKKKNEVGQLENCKLNIAKVGFMTRLEQIDFQLLGVTQSLKILTAFDNLLMFPQSARQMKTIKKRRQTNSTLRQFEIFDLYKLRKVDKCLPVCDFDELKCRRGAFINPLAR